VRVNAVAPTYIETLNALVKDNAAMLDAWLEVARSRRVARVR